MRTKLLLTYLLLLLAVILPGQITQNFDNGANTARSDCWDLPKKVSVVSSSDQAINTGSGKPLLKSGGLNGTSFKIWSPYIKFNSSGVITFKHRLHNTNVGTSRTLQINIVDLAGNIVSTPYYYDYTSEGTDIQPQVAGINISWSGTYRVQFMWAGVGGGALGLVDDIYIDGAYATTDDGNCNQMPSLIDTVCSGYKNRDYSIYYPNPTSHYYWSLGDPTSGTIDSSITANNSSIQVDWSGVMGMFTLSVYEISQEGCVGDTMDMSVLIDTSTTIVTLVVDTTCEGFSPVAHFTFTGMAPWIVEYTDGTTNFVDTTSSNPFVRVVPKVYPNVGSHTLTVTNLTQNAACQQADLSNLPSAPIIVIPEPVMGPIYHH